MDDLMQTAKESGIDFNLIDEDEGQIWYVTAEGLTRFAQLVAKKAVEAEREACAKAVEQAKVHQFVWYPNGSTIDANKIGEIYKHQHDLCVEAISALR